MKLWNNVLRAAPSDASTGSVGDDAIRETKVALRQRMELEHNFMSNGASYHKAGLCSILKIGTWVEILGLPNPKRGCIAYDKTNKMLKVFNGTNWVQMAPAHEDLTDLDADDHPQYLSLDKASQTLTESLAVANDKEIDGIDIDVAGGKLNAFVEESTGSQLITFVANTEDDPGEILSDEDAFSGFSVGDLLYTSSATNPGPFEVKEVVSNKVITTDDVVVDEEETEHVVFKLTGRFGLVQSFGSINTLYTAEQDCIILATISCSFWVPPKEQDFIVYCGLSFDVAGAKVGGSGASNYGSLMMYVKAGQTWRVNYTEDASLVYQPTIAIYKMDIY